MRAIEEFPIVSITPFTLQDFPGKSACILWFTGCNFACPYCHNGDLAQGKGRALRWSEIEAFLESRVGLLEGVVFSGGECCLHESVVEVARRVRAMGFALKVDTNGSRPKVVKALLAEGLADAFAIDFKAPLGRYGELVRWGAVEKWEESVRAIIAAKIDLEIRTTVHTDLHFEEDVNQMMRELVQLGYRGSYFVQNFKESETLGRLGAPPRRFELDALNPPKALELRTRNFPEKGG